MSQLYKRRPVTVEAVRFTEETLTELYDFMNIAGQGSFLDCGHGIDPTDGKFKITTPEGVMEASIGDYIIKGVQGELYPCKPEIFERLYEVA